MKVTFLGTGAGIPSKYRNTQSLILNFMNEIKECWMFDCGEATQHKIMYTNIKPAKIRRIFISHLHGDHILGLIGFLSTRSFLMDNKEQPITIYGPKGIKEYVEFNLELTQCKLSYMIEYVEYEKDSDIIFENDKVVVNYFKLDHTIDSYGLHISFKEQKGSLKVEELKKLGILPGPFYKTIKEQDKFIFNNKEYTSKDFLEENKKGKNITIIPDTCYFEDLLLELEKTDILISECTYLKEDEYNLATKHKHLNILDINNFYNYKKFDKIYLTHISSRYDKQDMSNILKNINLENLEIAYDLVEYEL